MNITFIVSRETIILLRFFYRPEQLKEEMIKYSTQETALYPWLKEASKDGGLDIHDLAFDNDQLRNLIKGNCF